MDFCRSFDRRRLGTIKDGCLSDGLDNPAAQLLDPGCIGRRSRFPEFLPGEKRQPAHQHNGDNWYERQVETTTCLGDRRHRTKYGLPDRFAAAVVRCHNLNNVIALGQSRRIERESEGRFSWGCDVLVVYEESDADRHKGGRNSRRQLERRRDFGARA